MTEFQFIRSTFYTLKRTFPASITLVNKLTYGVDINTGEITETYLRHAIRRAVVLHRRESNMLKTLFGHEAALRQADRHILIDYKDLGDFEIAKATTVEYDDENWSITEDESYSHVVRYLGVNRIVGDLRPSTPEPLDVGPF